MISAKAFAPANVSCIFKIYKHKEPRWMGSYGVGFTLNYGVIVAVTRSRKSAILFNDKKIRFPTVSSVINKLAKEKLKVNIKTSLPLGCGFGLSGASALATTYAMNRLLKLKKTKKELAIIAHTAEVKNKTGLGDVVNQFYGGFCIKLKPSSYFVVNKIPIKNINVYCKYFSKISTKAIITDSKLKNRINKSASKALSQIKTLMKNTEKIRFFEIIKISKVFAMHSQLLKDKKVVKTINKIEKKGGNASMIMLGNAVFSDTPFKGSIKFKISGKGAHLI